MKTTVLVRLKREVLDPQGDAALRALKSLGFTGVKGVRIGKLIEIELDAWLRRIPIFARSSKRWPTRCSRTR